MPRSPSRKRGVMQRDVPLIREQEATREREEAIDMARKETDDERRARLARQFGMRAPQ